VCAEFALIARVEAYMAVERAGRDEELPPLRAGTDLPACAGFASSGYAAAQWGGAGERGGLALALAFALAVVFKKAAAKKSLATAF
jgi:hypothetical protein